MQGAMASQSEGSGMKANDLAYHEALPFDEFDDDLMHDVCGSRLAKPIQALLITLSQIDMTKASFGEPDSKLALKKIIPELTALRKACVEEWRDQ